MSLRPKTKLGDLFGAYGTSATVTLVRDRDTGTPRGFAFVEMNDAQADAAIKAPMAQPSAIDF